MKIIKTEKIDNSVDYYSLPCLSKSFLSEFWKSPAHAFMKKDSPAMAEGRAIHEFILEPKKFWKENAVTDLNLATKAGKEWKEKNSDKNIIKEKDFQKFRAMRENFSRFRIPIDGKFPDMENILINSTVEQGYKAIVEIEKIGGSPEKMEFKIKPDFHYETEKKIFCFDLKTVHDANIGMFFNQARNLRYYWQSYLYSKVLAHHYGKPVDFLFLLVEKSPPHLSRCVRVHDEFLAEDEIQLILSEYLDWKETGADRAQGYEEIIEEIHIRRPEK